MILQSAENSSADVFVYSSPQLRGVEEGGTMATSVKKVGVTLCEK